MEDAVRRGDLKAVEECIRIESYWSERKKDASLLVLAIEKGYEDITLALLAAQTVGWADLREALDVASDKGLERVVQALLELLTHLSQVEVSGEMSTLKKINDPLLTASHEGDTSPALQTVSSCEQTPQEQMYELFRHACREVDFATVRSLLESGCSVSLLSRVEKEELLHCACTFDVVGRFAGDLFIVQALLQNVPVSILSNVEQAALLFRACVVGDLMVVDTLVTNGCSLNNFYMQVHLKWVEKGFPSGRTNLTPLMIAAYNGHEEIMKKLILAGAKVGMQDSTGYTALHYAAATSHIPCGILLAEAGASVRAKNKHSRTPLDIACSAAFRKAINEAISFTTRKTLCVIGNSEGGKSTLIAALQAEKSSLFGKIYNRLRKVDDNRKRTACIETVTHCSQEYGGVLFFDFAGQHEYHGPHQVFLESLLSNPGVSMTLLLVVKATEEEEAILHQLHRWLSPVALLATTTNPPQVIVIGSFLDRVKSKEEATSKLTRCIEATRKDLEQLPLQIVGSCLLNCRQPQSDGMDQLCRCLEEMPVPEFRATHTQYSLAWVLSQIKSSLKDQAVQLQEFSAWLQDNKANLPKIMPPPEEVCQDLSAAGHTLYLPNKEAPPKGWLVLDLPGILRDLYGTLFSHSKAIANEFGLLHDQQLTTLFPDLDVELIQQLLVCLEFCIPVDPSVLNVEMKKLTQNEDVSGWLFFPALISANPPQPISNDLPPQTVRYRCWQLKTSKKYSISAHVLQTILLRLAAHFVVKQRDEEGVLQHCCNVWWNGIAWRSYFGIDVTVCITNNRVIQVVTASCTSAAEIFRYQSNVISDILSTVKRLSPNLATAAYIVHPPILSAALNENVTAPSPKELFLVEGIRNAIADHNNYALSLKDTVGHPTTLLVSDLFGGWSPTLEDIERILWMQPQPSQPESSAELSETALTPSSTVTIPPHTSKVVSTFPNETPTAAATDRPLTPTAAATDRPLTPTAAATERPLTPTAAATDRPLTPTAAATDRLLTHTEAATDCPLTPTISSVDPLPTPTSPLQPSSPISPGAQALLDTSAVPTLNDVNELIVAQVAAKWPNLAIKLGVKDFLIDTISKNNPLDCEGACQDMLKRWLKEERNTGGKERTWSILLTALGRADFGELERSLRGEHFRN